MSKKINPEIRNFIYNKYEGKCAYCGIKLSNATFTIDHIIAKSKGGRNQISNYNPSCGSCNSSKATFHLEDWRLYLRNKIHIIRRDNSNFRFLEKFNLVEFKEDAIVEFYFEYYEQA